MNFIFDCDDVLLDWCSSFALWLKLRKGIDVDPAGPTTWDMREWLGGRAVRPLIVEFNCSQEFGWLTPLPGSVNALRSLRNDGHHLYVITSCGSDPLVIARRQQNLRDVFGPIFADIYTTDLGESKEAFLREIPRGVWVEDNFDNCFAAKGLHDLWMVRRPHNRRIEETTRHLTSVRWVDSVADMIALLTGKELVA